MDQLFLVLIFAMSLCWGSFLAASAYRITFEKPFLTARSCCSSCSSVISWYNNIPVLSWLILKGRCGTCKQPISLIYPFIEASTAITITALFIRFFQPRDTETLFNAAALPATFWFDYNYYTLLIRFAVYLIFISALILATATDLFDLVIPQPATLWLIPGAALAAFYNILPLTVWESLGGAFLGYAVLWIVATGFKLATRKEGLGVGDMELLAMIGAFLGPLGAWLSLMIGSIAGMIIAGFYLAITRQQATVRIPFGPFLSFGAILFLFYHQQLYAFLMLRY